MNSDNEFVFLPRPEAHAMTWNELLPPLRVAVRDLLTCLNGAVRTVNPGKKTPEHCRYGEYAASCFLVYGERGTGKTTVLLSAQNAVCDSSDEFFDEAACARRNADADSLRQAKNSADELKRHDAIWLDLLDLESLPLHANLLTTLLTRVRNALFLPGTENEASKHASILENGSDGARHKLDRLINDATLMWEDVHEPDTRSKSNRQIAAADIFAQFRARFLDAMETLSKELARRSGRGDKRPPIVLPIDNIDRSTEHLQSIVKLAQLVASPYLWLVLAGDREDIETFLERAYWKELISVDMGGGAAGKKGWGDEDEAYMMARRQAAAASHKLLPPSHRIEVDLVRPMDTLNFCAASVSGSGKSGGHSIYELLERVEIPNLGSGHDISFVELFDARNHAEDCASTKPANALLGEMVNEKGEIQFAGLIGRQTHAEDRFDEGIRNLDADYLTLAARLGLQLPARGVLDLWQLAYWAVNNGENTPLKAEKIARTMLRNHIAESKLSNKLSQCLQGNIIGRSPNGAGILNFRAPNPGLSATYTRASDFKLRVDMIKQGEGLKYAVRSTIFARGNVEIALFSLDGRAAERNDDRSELPGLVAAWLTVLHDIVLWSTKSWVLSTDVSSIKLDLAGVAHEAALIDGRQSCKEPGILYWPAPGWINFLAYDIFKIRWDTFRNRLHKARKNEQACPAKHLPCMLSLGWIACILDTFNALRPSGFTDGRNEATEWLASGIFRSPTWTDKSVRADENLVMQAAALLYSQIMNNDTNRERIFFACEGLDFMRDWLELKLPLLISHLYVPMDADIAAERKNSIKHELEKSAHGKSLLAAWQLNAPFILAGIGSELEDVFRTDEIASDGDPALSPYLKIEALPAPFADMHEFWRASESRDS